MREFDYSRIKEKIIADRFGHLNEMQRKAVYAVEGPVLILAGAGSGKTTVVINRIANLLTFGKACVSTWQPELGEEERGILESCAKSGELTQEAADIIAIDRPNPWNILAITFTNKAAGELRRRLSEKLGSIGEEVAAATFHSTCAKLLRSEIHNIGYRSDFTIYDTADSLRVIKDCMEELGIPDKVLTPKSILGMISSAKDALITPQMMYGDGQINYASKAASSVYELYEKKLKSANALDFDDLIRLTVKILSEFPEVLEKYRRRFKYIMVDEFQDTNFSQNKLVMLLAGGHRNICVVGDDDQSIYKFRGAVVENILDFEKRFPETRTIRLEQNYRSTSTILDAANAVIANNLKRKGKSLWTENGRGEEIAVYSAMDERAEASFIAQKIKDGLAEGTPYRDNAVLYRMNAQSGTIEQTFIRRGIPYVIVGGHKFFDRKEIKDVLAYLSVVNNPDDALRLRRIINEPKRGIGEKTVETAQEIAETLGLSLLEVLRTAEQYVPLSKKSGALMQFAGMIDSLAEMAQERPLIDTYREMLEKSGYTLDLLAKNDMESRGRLENIAELETTILKYCEETVEPSLSGFLEEIALYTELDDFDEADDKVVMMTLHSAKGLEFSRVFIAGMEEGIFPGEMSIIEPGEIEEERRLAYVGITRAKKKLFLTCAQTRMLYGRTGRNQPSRFVKEIPAELVKTTRENSGYASGSFYGGAYGTSHPAPNYSAAGNSRGPLKGKAVQTEYASSVGSSSVSDSIKQGSKVKHRIFGEGVVTKVTPMGGDRMLEIAFENHGTKRIMETYAKLEKV